jgi:tetratricopeptide (TPR) repeat protein
VAWVTERREVLSFSFGLLSLIAYARYAQAKASNQCAVISNQASGGRAADHGPRARDHRSLSTDHRLLFYLLSLFFLALGLMSKPMLVTWPCVMLLLDYWPLRRLELSTLNPRPSTTLRLVKEKIPFFVLAALASLVTFVVQKHAGSLTAGESLTLGERVGNALISYCRYIGKLFWPADLTLYYPHPGHWPLGNVLLAGGLILGISVLLWMRQRRAPYLLMGWLWYCGTLVPVSQVIQTATQAMADRWTYVPSLGMLILTVWGVSEVTRKWRQQALALAVVGGGAVVLCGALTRHQLGYWKNSETLGRHTLKVTRNNYTVYRGLGDALNERGRLDEAVSHFREAVRLKPDDAIARWSLGAALVKYGQIDEAIGQLQEALRLNPNSATVHNALGIAFDKKGQPDKAMSEFETALRLNSDYAEAHYNLGIVRSRKGQPDEAIRQYQEAVRLDPKYAEAHNDLGIALGTKGRMDEAMVQFQAAIGCRPGYAEAHYNLGLALGLKGRTDEAIGQFEQALQAKPDYPEAHNYLGMALCQRGRASEGIRHFQEALRFRPGYADARRNLDAALAAKARTTQLPAAPNPPPP